MREGVRGADVMRWVLAVAAGVELTLVGLWIVSFVGGGAVGSTHQQWYVELPLLFLLIPAASAAFAALARRISPNVRSGVSLFLLMLLGLNLCAFVVYVGLSGGGV